MQNEQCPITLELLSEKDEDEVFVHLDIGFDMVALYEYLSTAPQLTNPMNRAPFTLQDLERLEVQMERLFGKDCIQHAPTDDEEDADENEDDDDEHNHHHDERTDATTEERGGQGVADEVAHVIDWMDDTEVITRLRTHITDVDTDPETQSRFIRLRVDIDMNDALRQLERLSPPTTPSSPPTEENHAFSPRPPTPPSPLHWMPPPRHYASWASLTSVEEQKEEEEEEEEEDVVDVDADALPPRRTFPSVTDMYRDPNRSQRIMDRLSLLQYLEYDAMALLVQFMETVYDDHFHRFVWQHTSLDVIDTVTTYLTAQEQGGQQGRVEAAALQQPDHDQEMFTHITEPSPHPSLPADYDLEVVYTECWEVYRIVILQNLERRYAETVRDIRHISMHDYQALMASHRSLVQQRAREQEVSYDRVLEILQRIENNTNS